MALRGGGWDDASSKVLGVTTKVTATIGYHFRDAGFRCVRENKER
jgi:hypothetical protein